MNAVMPTDTSTILLSGAGQLGSRHLQGLSACRIPLEIHVHDVQPESLAVAEQRWSEVASVDTPHTILTHNDFDSLPPKFDLVIVASNAKERPTLVHDISSRCDVKFWVLEKVLAQSEAGLDEIVLSIGKGGNAWVNTPRRMFDWHKQIKTHLLNKEAMHIKVDGGLWGLACNSIHFLELFAWWTGESLKEIKTGGLDAKWFEGKRPGNWEVLGTLEAGFSSGSQMILHAQQGEVRYSFEFTDGVNNWQMIEQDGTAHCSNGLEISGRIPFQSELSGSMAESILENGSCGLPMLDESVEIHRVFLRSMQQHWNMTMDSEAICVPIT